MGWNIFHQNTSCIDRSVFSHRHARRNGHIVSNPSVFVDDNWPFLSCATFLQKIGDHHIHTIPSHIRVIFLDAKLMMLSYLFPLYTQSTVPCIPKKNLQTIGLYFSPGKPLSESPAMSSNRKFFPFECNE